MIGCTIALVSCGKTLDATKVETSIRDSIVLQGGTSLKSVICPTNVKPAEGQVFECVGVLDSESGFAIPVRQQDNQGNVQWAVPSVKGLLNMPEIQTAVQNGLQKEVGAVAVDCGSGLYKPAKPGEIFECKLLKRTSPSESKKTTADTASSQKLVSAADGKAASVAIKGSSAPNQSDTVQVTIEPSGDVNWQRIIRVQVAQAATPSEPAASANPKPDAKPPANSPAPPAGKSAEDFLNQPGAADDFE